MLAVQLADLGRPSGITARDPYRLIGPLETHPRKWARMRWTDLYSGRSFRVTTSWPGGGDGVAGISSIDAVAEANPFHPEAKRLGPDGAPCRKQSEGRLQRRMVRGAGTICIGKEAHRLEDRGLVADLDELLNTYSDLRRDPWTTQVLPRLRVIAAEQGGLVGLADTVQMSERRLRDVLNGRSRPRQRVKAALQLIIWECLPGGA